ncbi:MAG: ribonuclease P protein component [Balneolaceae bacterium]|nr:ribonuclease P protein component [Balneolaceae bacterium]
MRKDRSRTSSADEPDRSLPRNRILRGRKAFQNLFSRNASHLRGTYADLRYHTRPSDNPEYKMAFIVPRRMGKAVRRNQCRRRLKEAFRHHQTHLSETVDTQQITFQGALMATSIDAGYHELEGDVRSLLEQARERLTAASGPRL